MRKTRLGATALLVLSLGFGGVAAAGAINPKRHPALAQAQRHCEQAFQAITAAQKANEFDLGGHAQRAKELLAQANRELLLATKESNQNRRD